MLEPWIIPASYAGFFMFMLVHMLALVVSFLAIYASVRRLCSRYGDISIFLTAYLYCFRLFCAQCMCSSTRVWFSSLVIPDVWYLTTVSIYNSTVYTLSSIHFEFRLTWRAVSEDVYRLYVAVLH